MLACVAASCGGTGNKEAAAPAVTSAQVVAAFQRAGLPAVRPRRMTAADFGLAPKLTGDGTRFLIPQLGQDSGGRALVFRNPDDLARTRAYYADLGRQSAALSSWVFADPSRHVLLQLNPQVPPALAHRYQAVVERL